MGRIIFADDDEIMGGLISNAFIAAGHAIGWLKHGKAAGGNQAPAPRSRYPRLQHAINVRRDPAACAAQVADAFRSSGADADRCQSDAIEQILRYEGANDYLTKPFNPVTLVGRAEAIMNGERRF